MGAALSVIFFFLILRFVVTLFNFISDPKLRRVSKHYNQPVSILIPVRNEEHRILSLLQSIHQQDYQNYEVIILNDNSTDNTAAVCQDFTAEHQNFKLVNGDALPNDWTGKNYACHQLVQLAKGNFLLFIDADTRIAPGFINSALHRMAIKNLGLLSLFPNQQIQGFGEHCVVPLMHYLLLNLLPLQLVYLLKGKTASVASGQCMLFDAATYHRQQWHQQARQTVVEESEIMRLVKSNGYNAETLLANNLISSRMYSAYLPAVNGFSKNMLAAFNYSVFALLVYLVLLLSGPLIVAATLNLSLIAFMCTLIILTRVMISLAAGQNVFKDIILHPLQMFSLMLISFLSIQRYLTRTTIWKGRRV